jgi:hypothetical protein
MAMDVHEDIMIKQILEAAFISSPHTPGIEEGYDEGRHAQAEGH